MGGQLYIYIFAVHFSPGWWGLDRDQRSSINRNVDDYIAKFSSDAVEVRSYRSILDNADMIYWVVATDPSLFASFKYRVFEEYRGYVFPAFSSLSIYRQSPYVSQDSGGSRSEHMSIYLDMEPLRYLVAYPMKKHPEWYLLPYGERREIMGEHIKMARELSDPSVIRSYTTYSFGVSDHEFMVIYEVADLASWIDVTWKLREARARKWVVKEEPILVGEFIKRWRR